jgi:hypothetical protein
MSSTGATTSACPPRELTDRERAVLDFEREWWQLPGPKESQIRVRFGTSGTTYYRMLSALIELRSAFDYDPLTVMRLRHQRNERRRTRVEGPRLTRNS